MSHSIIRFVGIVPTMSYLQDGKICLEMKPIEKVDIAA